MSARAGGWTAGNADPALRFAHAKAAGIFRQRRPRRLAQENYEETRTIMCASGRDQKVKIMNNIRCELEGAELDAAVATAVGDVPDPWSPSTNWAQGGPIIERERIYLACLSRNLESVEWEAGADCYYGNDGPQCKYLGYGPTPLIAAMRAFVAKQGATKKE